MAMFVGRFVEIIYWQAKSSATMGTSWTAMAVTLTAPPRKLGLLARGELGSRTVRTHGCSFLGFLAPEACAPRPVLMACGRVWKNVTTEIQSMATDAAENAPGNTVSNAFATLHSQMYVLQCAPTGLSSAITSNATTETWTTVTDARGRVVSNADTFAWGQVQGAAQLPAETAWLQGTRSATTATLMPVTDAVRLAQWRRASRVPIKHADRHHQRHHAQRSAGTEL